MPAPLSFEGFSKFYPNCKVISGYGTPAVWCRLPDNTTRRCVAQGDIRYGNVLVAIASGNLAVAFNPFEGRQLLKRAEQFIKVRSGASPEETTNHSFFPFYVITFDKFANAVDRPGGSFPFFYADSFKIWGKVDNATPIEIDTINFTDSDTISYGNSLSIAFDGATCVGFAGRTAVDAGLSNNAYSIWHAQLTSNVVAIYTRIRLIYTTAETRSLLFITLYQISDDPATDNEVIYREVSFISSVELSEEGDAYTGLLSRGDVTEYELLLPPRMTATFASGVSGSPCCVLGNFYSMPERGFSTVAPIEGSEFESRWAIASFRAPTTNEVFRSPFSPPIPQITNWQRKTAEIIDPDLGEFSYEYQRFDLGYSGEDFGPFLSGTYGANYYKPSILPPDPDPEYSYVLESEDGSLNVRQENFGIQYSYQHKTFWTLDEQKPLITLTDEQHQSYEATAGDTSDPYILPNPPFDCNVDLGAIGTVLRISPRGGNADPFSSGLREDSHMLYYLMGDDRLFHVYQRDTNDSPPAKIEEFRFNINLDDLTTLGAPNTCYISNAAQINSIETDAESGDLTTSNNETASNYAIALDEAFIDLETSRLSVCHGSLSWRTSEEVLFTVPRGATYTRYMYPHTVCAFGMFPTYV